MGELFVWWLAAEALGIVVLPLAVVLGANLPDRGWGLARPLGLLVLGWLVWFPLSVISALPYSRGWIAGTLVALALANAALLRVPDIRAALRRLLVREWGYLLAGEAVFAGSFALMGWERSFTPAVVNQEKFMDVAFLSSIWRAPHLPPPDPWLSGYPINYYYFGHFLVATMAKLLDTPPAVAFNTSIALIFALTASAVFAVASNLVAALQAAKSGSSSLKEAITDYSDEVVKRGGEEVLISRQNALALLNWDQLMGSPMMKSSFGRTDIPTEAAADATPEARGKVQ